jgi:hypothetical protein
LRRRPRSGRSTRLDVGIVVAAMLLGGFVSGCSGPGDDGGDTAAPAPRRTDHARNGWGIDCLAGSWRPTGLGSGVVLTGLPGYFHGEVAGVTMSFERPGWSVVANTDGFVPVQLVGAGPVGEAPVTDVEIRLHARYTGTFAEAPPNAEAELTMRTTASSGWGVVRVDGQEHRFDVDDLAPVLVPSGRTDAECYPDEMTIDSETLDTRLFAPEPA